MPPLLDVDPSGHAIVIQLIICREMYGSMLKSLSILAHQARIMDRDQGPIEAKKKCYAEMDIE